MDLSQLYEHAPARRARDWLYAHDAATVAEQIELTRIAAPPFGEEVRGAELLRRFEAIGLEDTHRDAIGNVFGRLPGTSGVDGAVLLIAHLDTVFPADTSLEVRHEPDGRILAPGITDNSRGLAGMLALARALVAAGLRMRRPLYFVGSVGEEGLGDLRGVKHIFAEGSRWRAASAVVALDGTGLNRIVTRGAGSRRLRVRLHGPGGHSWSDWGIVNPAHALGAVIAAVAALPLPAEPKTTLTVARIGGGKSVNAIPEEAWMELDLRSEGAAALVQVERAVRQRLDAAVAVENQRAGAQNRRPALVSEVEIIGDRPPGAIAPDAELLSIARAATGLIGTDAEEISSSTDANVPMAAGIPALTLGCGGDGGGIHTRAEWYLNENGALGLERCLWVTLAAAGLGGVGTAE
jgi:tripeptide aminopeptidase